MRRDSDRARSRAGRVRFAAAIVVLASVGAAFQSFDLARQLARHSPDPFQIEIALLRFSALGARLPASAVVGYLSDLPPGDRATLAFLQAQYALAPRLLRPLPARSRPDWAVGNLSRPLDLRALGAEYGYVVEQDFGNGVVLYRRAGP